MSNLPQQTRDRIEKQAESYGGSHHDHMFNVREYSTYNDLLSAYIAGATEYAIKLQLVENEIEDKVNEIERLRRIVSKHKSGRTYQEQKSTIEKMRALLEKVIYRHEAGLLPDRFIYEEIKTFLDGAK